MQITNRSLRAATTQGTTTTPTTPSTTTNITQNFIIVGAAGAPIALFTSPRSGTTPSLVSSTSTAFFAPPNFTRSAAVNTAVIETALAESGTAFSPVTGLMTSGQFAVSATPESQLFVASTPEGDFGNPSVAVVNTPTQVVTTSPNIVTVGATASPTAIFTPPVFTRSAAVNAAVIQSALAAQSPTGVASTPEADFGIPSVAQVTTPTQVVVTGSGVATTPVRVGNTSTPVVAVTSTGNIVTLGTTGSAVALFTPPLF